jgi:hypothetical protein
MDKVPYCPKCGCPARVVVIRKARVKCVLESDGTVGEVLSTSRDSPVVEEYECGGNHTWKGDK